MTDTAVPSSSVPARALRPDSGERGAPYRHSPTRTTKWKRVAGTDLVIGVVLAVLSWPASTHDLLNFHGLYGWQTSIAMAAQKQMEFGTQIIFTYGPLGFLDVPQLDYRWTAVSAFLFVLVLSIGIFTTLTWSLKRALPVVPAVVVAYVVGTVAVRVQMGPEYVLALVLVACVALLHRSVDEPPPQWIWVGLGVVLAIFTLVKVSFFVGIVVVLAVTVACLEGGRLRAAAATAVGAVSTFCLCWFGTGNGFGNLIPFAKSSAAIIGGYSAAMSAEDPGRGSSYWYSVIVVVVIAVFAVAAVRGLPRRQTIGIGLVTALTVWLLFKEGFVRHDAHDLIFFSAAPLILMAFVPRSRPWTVVPGALLLTVVTVLVASGSPSLVARPDGSIRNFSEEVATLGSPGRTSAFIQRNRRLLRKAYAIPEGMLDKMKGHTVDVSPWEETVAWTYPQMQFDPLPVIADYSAYTPSLDQTDTDFLRGPRAPRFILRRNQSIDGRNPAFEPPATQLAIECRYRQVEHDGWTWQLLERGADRCGAPRYLGSVTTRSRQWVRVPTAPTGDLVAARFQFSLGAAWTLESTLFKPPNVFMESVDYDGTQKWRFVAATGPDLHVIRVSPTLGYNAGFEQSSLTRFRFLIAGQDPEVKVTFYAIRRLPMAGDRGQVNRKPVTSATGPGHGAAGGPG